MNKLSVSRQIEILNCLVEGVSVRGTSRLTKASKNTILKLLVDVGKACQKFQRYQIGDFPLKIIQVDEIWSFCKKKERNKSESDVSGEGSVWTWVAICAETKFVPYWYVGTRNRIYGWWFMKMLDHRIKGRAQITSDGYKTYTEAVRFGFGDDNVDFAMYKKIYGQSESGKRLMCIGVNKEVVFGHPKEKHVSTSFCERQNLTMRMGMRRFTRKTNAFSKKFQNHELAVALHFMHYNFVRVHQTIKTTPACAAGVADHVWTMEEVINLADNVS